MTGIEKLENCRKERQPLMDFLSFAAARGVTLAAGADMNINFDYYRICKVSEINLVNEFFGIDSGKLDEEMSGLAEVKKEIGK